MTNNYGLTDEDCLELYYVVDGDDDLATAIGTDGELLYNGMFEPTKDQWDNIRGSLEGKRDAIDDGFYGCDRVTKEWSQHLDNILSAISAY